MIVDCIIDYNKNMTRHTKIVCTLGPSCSEESTLLKMIEAGMDVARLNFSHGTHADHQARIVQLRELSKKTGKPLTILQDLQGPKLRIGELPGTGLDLKTGDTVLMSSVGAHSSAPEKGHLIPFDFPELFPALAPGRRVLLDDGKLEFEVTAVTPTSAEARVVLGGLLSSHKGVNLPGTPLPIPSFTEKDATDLAFGLEQGVDAVAMSFVRKADDVREVRAFIAAHTDRKVILIAKLERPEALDHLEEILHAVDGVMVARGDLGVELSPARVPSIQKQIIHAANMNGKVVITATQMLDSMMHAPRPTRAEASDIANAIFDGTDAVMLSGETASGEYPVESVAMMQTIVCEAEEHYGQWGHCADFSEADTQDDATIMTRAGRELAHDKNVTAVVVFTASGRTAELMSKVRPGVPILAFTPEENTFHQMGLLWGVRAFMTEFVSDTEKMIAMLEKELVHLGRVKPGEQVVIIAGYPVGARRPPNLAMLHTIGEK
jgi:pyruvate kinase